MLCIDNQPRKENQAAIKQKKGETKPAASDSPRILQIRDIVEYSGHPGSTQPWNGMGKIMNFCKVHMNIRPVGGGETIR